MLWNIIENVAIYIQKSFINLTLTAFWYYNYAMAHIEFIWYSVKNTRTEPNILTWNCVCTMDNCKLLEHYSYDDTMKIVDKSLCIRKEDRRHLCVSEYNMNAIIEGTPNNTRFLNVQYVHPAMKLPLTLKLDVSYIRNGNELFSCLHVLRLLNHQYSADEYVFDNNYEVHLMDHTVNKVIIKSHEYMKLDDLQYKLGYAIIAHK